MQCDPICISLFQDIRIQYCNYCLQRKDTVRCSGCKQYYYCSSECQKQDWKQHKSECVYLKSMRPNAPCNLLQALRIHSNVINIDELYGDMDKVNMHRLKEYQECAVVIATHMGQQNTDTIQQLLILQIKAQFNMFTVTDVEGVSIGVGIYTPANYFDHKCQKIGNYTNVANCSHFYRGRQLIVMTNDSFVKQDELSISYTTIPQYQQRQKYLEEQYGFKCNCERCQIEIHQQPKDVELIDLKSNKFDNPNVFSDPIYYELLSQYYLQLLTDKKYKKAYKVVVIIITNMPTWLNNKEHPFIGWKHNEASKLAFHLNYLLKAEEHSKQAILLLKQLYADTQDFKELEIRFNDIKSEIKMNK